MHTVCCRLTRTPRSVLGRPRLMTATPIGKWPRAGLRCAPHLPCSEMQHARTGTDRCRVSEWLDPSLRKQLARAQAEVGASTRHVCTRTSREGLHTPLRVPVRTALPRAQPGAPADRQCRRPLPGANARPRASSLCRTVTTPAII